MVQVAAEYFQSCKPATNLADNSFSCKTDATIEVIWAMAGQTSKCSKSVP